MELIEESTESDTRVILRHYVEMLGRHIVADNDLRDLAKQLYERHKEAFDFVFECRPEPENLIGEVRRLLSAATDLAEDAPSASIIRFAPKSWKEFPPLNACSQTVWTHTGRSLLFEAKTVGPDRINLKLIIGPADTEIRKRIYSGATARAAVFKGLVKPMGKMWSSIYSRDLLTSSAARDMDWDQKVEAIEVAWKSFLEDDLPPLERSILEIVSQADGAEGGMQPFSSPSPS